MKIRIISLSLCLLMLINILPLSACADPVDGLLKNGSTVKQTESDRKKMLNLSKSYYELCYPLIEHNTAGLKMKLPNQPDFNSKSPDIEKGTELTRISAESTISMSIPYYSIASGAAALACSPDSGLAAHNLAAAIRISLARIDTNVFENAGLHPREDCAALYLYSIMLEPNKVNSYLNIGNIFLELVDQKSKPSKTPYISLSTDKSKLLDKAKEFFEKVLTIDRENVEACKGIASYYYAKGDTKKWIEWMMKGASFAGFNKKAKEKSDKVEEVAKPTSNGQDISEDQAKKAIDDLSAIEVYTTADYLEEIDPQISSAIRQKIASLPRSDMTLVLPQTPYASDVLSYEIYSKKEAEAVSEYYNRIEEQLIQWEDQYSEKERVLSERYEQFQENSDLDRMEELTELIAQGDKSALEELNQLMNQSGSGFNPLSGYNIAAGKTVENIIKANNLSLFLRRYGYYGIYFTKKMEKAQKFYDDRRQLFDEKITEDMDAEDAQLEPLIEQQNRAEDDLQARQIKLKIIQIQNDHISRRNTLRQSAFADLTSEIYPMFSQVMSFLPRMWDECVLLVRFMDETDQRDLYYYQMCDITIGAARTCMDLAAGAGSLDDWEIPFTGDEEALQHEIEQIQKQREEASKEAARKAQEQAERDKIPVPIRALQTLLGKDSSFSLGFGPVSFSVTPTSFTLEGAFIGAGEFSYDWVENKVTGGLGVGGQFEKFGDEVGAKTLVTVTFDCNTGDVTEVDWKASASANLKITDQFNLGGTYTTSVMHGSQTSASLGWGEHLGFSN